MIITDNKSNAWDLVKKIEKNASFEFNQYLSDKIGHKIYDFNNGWVSDLEDRLEVNLLGGRSYSIWIGCK